MMHKFDYKNQIKDLYTPDVVNSLCSISKFQGRQDLFLDTSPEVLNDLLKYAKFNSIISSNRIEGINIDQKSKDDLLKDKFSPVSRSEKELAGYRGVLELVHESNEFIPIKPKVILQLHRDMYKNIDLSFKGQYKNADNIIQEIDKEGNRRVRFYTVPAVATEAAVEDMCASFEEAWEDNEVNRVLLSMMFILDFLCIHPFIDGNGRLSRLLTLLLMYKCGLIAGKYISIECIIEESKLTYYESLRLSSEDWHENNNNYLPFVDYMLGVIMRAYGEFENKISRSNDGSNNKPKVVELAIKETLGKQTKREIREKCPGVSDVTIARTLSRLQKEGKVEKIGGGRYTYYVSKF